MATEAHLKSLFFRGLKPASLILFVVIAFLLSAAPSEACWNCAFDNEDCIPTWTGYDECLQKIFVVQGHEWHVCTVSGFACSFSGGGGGRPPV